MSFRVTGTMIFNRLMSNMRLSTQTIGDLQEQMVTMRRINRPSDDPTGASRAQSLLSGEHDYQQYLDNIDQARGVMDFAAGVLETVSNEVVNARVKLLSAISPTADATSKRVIASELDDILRSIVAEANSSFAGMSVFGGTRTGEPPFEITSESSSGIESVAYHGNSGRISFVVGPNDTADVNEDPVDVFMPRGQAAGLFDTIIEIRKVLQNPDNLSEKEQAEKLSGMLKRMDTIHDDVVRGLGRLGTRSKALQIRRDLYEQAQISSTQRRSEIEDADIADVALRLQNQQTIFQVILSSSSSVFNSNLTEFLK